MFNKFGSNNRSGGSRGGDRGGRSFGGGDRGDDRSYSRPEMFRTTCATCGNSCEVPFKPANGKPIYCRPCFQNQEDSAPKFAGKSFNSSSFEKFRSDEKQMFATTCSTCGDRCEVPFKPMPGRPIYCRDCMGNKDEGFNDRGPREDRGAMSRPTPSKAAGAPTQDQFDKLNAKMDKVLKILEMVMAEVELDAKEDMEDEDFDEDFADEDFEDIDEEMFDENAEVKPAKKTLPAKKRAQAKKEVPVKKDASAKEPAAKKPTRGQVKRAKRTGKTL